MVQKKGDYVVSWMKHITFVVVKQRNVQQEYLKKKFSAAKKLVKRDETKRSLQARQNQICKQFTSGQKTVRYIHGCEWSWNGFPANLDVSMGLMQGL